MSLNSFSRFPRESGELAQFLFESISLKGLRVSFSLALLHGLSGCGARTGLPEGESVQIQDTDAGGDSGDSDSNDSPDSPDGDPDAGKPCEKLSINTSSVLSSTTVIKGDYLKTLACWNFINGCPGDIYIDTLTAHRFGAGSSTDLYDLFIPKVSDGKKIDPVTQNVTFNAIHFPLPGSSTTQICVGASIDSNPGCGGQHGLEIINPAGVKVFHEGGKPFDPTNIDGKFPAQGPLSTISCSPPFSVGFNGPSTKDVSTGTVHVTCLDLNLKNLFSKRDLELRNFEVEIDVMNTPTAGGGLINTTVVPAVPNYSYFRMTDGAATLLGPSELSASLSDKNQTLVLGGTFVLPSGAEKKVSIGFDVASNSAMIGDQIRCVLKNLATPGKGFVRDGGGMVLDASLISPNGDIVGNPITIK